MPEEVTIREDLQVIQVASYGVVTAAEFDASLDAILNIRDEQRLTKVFVDATNVKSYPSTGPIFEFGTKLARLAQGIKFAIAASPEVRNDPEFFETVTRNRGANARVFDSADAALVWLTKEPNNPMQATPNSMNSRHVFQFGCMELTDDYAVITCNEGVNIDSKEIEAIEAVLNTSYSKKRFGFIAHRVNSYSINPFAVRKLFVHKNLVAGAIVGGSEHVKHIANLEFEIIGGPPKEHFEDMSSAVKWIEGLVREDAGDI